MNSTVYFMKSELHMCLTKNVMACKVIRNFYNLLDFVLQVSVSWQHFLEIFNHFAIMRLTLPNQLHAMT